MVGQRCWRRHVDVCRPVGLQRLRGLNGRHPIRPPGIAMEQWLGCRCHLGLDWLIGLRALDGLRAECWTLGATVESSLAVLPLLLCRRRAVVVGSLAQRGVIVITPSERRQLERGRLPSRTSGAVAGQLCQRVGQ